MPIHQGKDKKGYYWQWGHQKKYYYRTPSESYIARNKAVKQGIAIKYKGGDLSDIISGAIGLLPLLLI